LLGKAEQPDAVDRAGITAFRGNLSNEPAWQLILGVWRGKDRRHTVRRPSVPVIRRLLAGVLLVGCSRSNVAPSEAASSQETVTVKTKVQLELVGRLPRKPGGSVGHMTLHGKHVLLVNEDAGFQVVDVSNPAAPRTTGSYRPKHYLGPFAASGDHAYVVEKGNRLRVLNVSDPAQPRVVGSSQLPGEIVGLAAAGKHVYVSVSESLRVLDVSDPTSPREVGTCGGLELARRVTVAGNYAYVAADFNGMRIIDVSNPVDPTEIGLFEGPGNVTKVAIVDKSAYLADYSGGLYVVDISNPKKPRQIGRYGDFVVGDVAVAGKHALLAAGFLDVIDVSKPDRPKQVGSFSQEECDTAWSVAAAGDFAYTISDAGLFVFRLTSPAGSR
jgi:hypothetical protein